MGRAPQGDLPVNPLGGRRRNPIPTHSGRAGSKTGEGRSKKEGVTGDHYSNNCPKAMEDLIINEMEKWRVEGDTTGLVEESEYVPQLETWQLEPGLDGAAGG